MNQPTEQPINETVDEPVVEFVPLLDFENDYEILNQYPFTIRKKSNHRIVSEYIESNGYFRLRLNQNKYLKHVLVAKQFITNDDPEHKTQIDHINKNRTDYHLSNLRWVSPTANQQNKSSHLHIQYEYIDKISDESIIVDEYNNHQFTDYFFYDDVFYFFNGVQYRKLYINTDKRNGSLFVIMKDNDGKNVNVYYSKFKRLHDLL